MNEHKKISEKVLEKIEENHATPHSKIYFVWRNTVLWGCALVTLVLGGLVMSSLIFRLTNFSRVFVPGVLEIREEVSHIFFLLPLLWVIALVVFGYIAYQEIRSTKEGYKYELSTVLLMLVLLSGILGAIFYRVGSGYVLDHVAARFVPFHHDVEMLQKETWFRPEEGFLVGEVKEVKEESFLLEDPAMKLWNISYISGFPETEKVFVTTDAYVGVRGEMIDVGEGFFTACIIRPLDLRGTRPRPPERGLVDPNIITQERTLQNERKNIEERIIECEGVRPLDTISH